MDFHPIADLFPLMKGVEFDEFVEDLRINGLREPITIYQGKILDGRNRWRACDATGVEPQFSEYRGDDPVSYVVSLNCHRRHLTDDERAFVAAKICNLQHGQNATRCGAEFYNKTPNQRTIVPNVVTQAQAAKMLNVPQSMVAMRNVILNKGTPEDIQAIEKKEKTVTGVYNSLKITRKNKEERPLVDINTLPVSAQEKLQAAIRQETHRLQLEFDNAVQAEVMRAIEETVLPQYNKERAEFRQVVQSRKGVMDRATYRMIAACLHPDRVTDEELKSRFTKAFHAFTNFELILCNEKEMPTTTLPFPNTYEDMMKRRAEIKKQNRARKTKVQMRA